MAATAATFNFHHLIFISLLKGALIAFIHKHKGPMTTPTTSRILVSDTCIQQQVFRVFGEEQTSVPLPFICTVIIPNMTPPIDENITF